MIRKTLNKIIIFFCLLIIESNAAFGYVILSVPGQNGLGSGIYYVAQQLGTNLKDFKTGAKKIFPVDIPRSVESIDLGQNNCISFLKQSFDENVGNNEYIIHATSQGTATVLNFLKIYPEAQNNLKAIILEAPLASGNSAIFHHANQQAWFVPEFFVKKLGPSFVQSTMFPAYDRFGLQAISSIESIEKKDIVIILVHSTNDRCLPYYGACALYYRLNELGHKKVYLVTKENSSDHINILRTSSIIQRILEKNDIHQDPRADCSFMNNDYKIKDCQPDFRNFNQSYKSILTFE